MRAVGVDAHARRVLGIVDIAAEMRAALQDQHFPPLVRKHAGDRAARQAAAHDDVIGFRHSD
jgi:hypothetical protein